jgi:hypothetical protein
MVISSRSFFTLDTKLPQLRRTVTSDFDAVVYIRNTGNLLFFHEQKRKRLDQPKAGIRRA